MREYQEIITFWFSKRVQPMWFRSTAEFDEEVRERFLATWQAAAAGERDSWRAHPEGALALVIVSALAYAWNNARRIQAKSYVTPAGAKVYQIQGPLFFGSSEGFAELFDVAGDPGTVIVDFADSRVVDQSALQAIEAVAAKYEAAGKRLQLRHLSRDCHRLLSKAGHLMVDSDDDPDYALAVDYHVRTGILGGH